MTSLIAVVKENDDLDERGRVARGAHRASARAAASRASTSLSKRATVKSSGACDPPLLVMIQPEGAVASVDLFAADLRAAQENVEDGVTGRGRGRRLCRRGRGGEHENGRRHGGDN